MKTSKKIESFTLWKHGRLNNRNLDRLPTVLSLDTKLNLKHNRYQHNSIQILGTIMS